MKKIEENIGIINDYLTQIWRGADETPNIENDGHNIVLVLAITEHGDVLQATYDTSLNNWSEYVRKNKIRAWAYYSKIFPKVYLKKKPTLDDYKTITSYEDACEALGIKPILYTDENDKETVVETGSQHFIAPKHLVALYKLETISRALWGKEWQPKPDAEGSEVYYYPWFFLYTKKEIERMTIQQTGARLSAYADHGAAAGFGYLVADGRSSRSSASFGFRLCQETEDKAKYFGSRIFVKLWAEYLRFNFATGDFLIDD